MNNLFEKELWGNTVTAWLIAIGITAACVIAVMIIQKLIVNRLKKFASTTTSTADDFILLLLQRVAIPLAYILCVYASIRYLSFGTGFNSILHTAILVVIVFFVIKAIVEVARYFLNVFVGHKGGEQSRHTRGILLIIKIIVWLLGVLFIVDNLGYNITTIVAGMGIGGIAIALAAQTILGDLFSYLAIFFDKPFETGDFIIVGDKMGTVEYIGIKTTRLRALGGEQLILSNADLTSARVQNYKSLARRRVVSTIGVVYETTPAQLRAIPAIIKKAVEAEQHTQFDRAHFFAFDDSSLQFEIVYYILTADYNVYMDCQQQINLSIMEGFEEAGIEFAYPTQRLLFENGMAKNMPSN